VLKKIASRFILASLNIQAILQEVTIDQRRQRLRAMGNGLNLSDTYQAMLEKIKAQGGDKARLGMAVLMWISYSWRPLQVDELCHAIAIRIGSTDLESDDIPAISTLLGYCQGLVAIDKSTSTARLIHYTLKEYLFAHPDHFGKAHSTMAEICLTYLNFQHVKDLSAGPSPDPRGTPFLEYSSLYWGTHMKMELSIDSKTLALELLLDQFDSHVSAKPLWSPISWGLTLGHTPDCKPFSALHCVSYLGIAEVADILIKMNRWDVNGTDDAGMTPLIWAARYGHEEVVRLLLREKHIQPDQHDTGSGRTALSWAAGNGDEGLVRLLLGSQFVNPGSLGHRWGKAWRAAGQLFGRRYINPDSSCRSGRTPLSWAAENGREGVVKLLLGRGDVNPNRLDRYGRTPLLWAVRNDHEGVVKLLFGRKDLNPDIPDPGYGQTPLSWAAGYGREGVVRLLLERKDVTLNGSSKSGRTPLLWAAENGYERIVELLLERGDANPDIPETTYGQTPLSRAALKGREGVVRLLLGRSDVNPDTKDTEFGRTPLSWAAENGHDGIVKLLLCRNDVDPDKSSKSGRTPLSWAAGNGHEGIMKLLLCRGDVSPDARDTDFGRTPLSWAAENGHERIVKLLLCRDDVHPDTRDAKFGRTPLSWAAGNGREGIVEILLGRCSVNPHRSSKSGRTPFLWAAENGHEGIVRLLLEQTRVDPDTPDAVFGQTPLLWAARNGREGVVKLLLEQKNVNPSSLSKSGQTPLTLAAEHGHDRVMELLRARHLQDIPQLGPP